MVEIEIEWDYILKDICRNCGSSIDTQCGKWASNDGNNTYFYWCFSSKRTRHKPADRVVRISFEEEA